MISLSFDTKLISHVMIVLTQFDDQYHKCGEHIKDEENDM